MKLPHKLNMDKFYGVVFFILEKMRTSVLAFSVSFVQKFVW